MTLKKKGGEVDEFLGSLGSEAGKLVHRFLFSFFFLNAKRCMDT